jgi:hypothetical protein
MFWSKVFDVSDKIRKISHEKVKQEALKKPRKKEKLQILRKQQDMLWKEPQESKYGHFVGCQCQNCNPENTDMIAVVKDAAKQLDHCWGHGIDGSDLIVDNSKLFDIIFNVAIKALVRVEKVLISDRLMIVPDTFKNINGVDCWTCSRCKVTLPKTFNACPYCSRTNGGYRMGVAWNFKTFEEFCKEWKFKNKCQDKNCNECKENCRNIYMEACKINYNHIGICKKES